MRIGAHLVATIASQVLCFFAGFLLFVSGYRCTDLLPPPAQMVLLAGGGFLGARLLFRRVIPARCPECAGSAFPHGMQPIVYVCESCGREEVTTAYERIGGGGR